MRRSLARLLLLFASRAVTPLAMLFFLLLYIGIAFFSAEPLTTLISITRDYVPVALVLALIPVNCAFRLLMELRTSVRRRAVMKGETAKSSPEDLFAETVRLSGTLPLAALKERLESFGYRIRLTGSSLAACRGISLLPARLLFLVAIGCLFTGILVSTTTRSSRKVAVIEGEPFPLSPEGHDLVERITFADRRGLFLEKTLSIEVAGKDGKKRVFGIYLPALYHGFFVYPRYLGIAPLIRFTAPDLPAGFESYVILMIYPPGKEDSAEIPGTGYRIVFSMAKPDVGDDPFRSGRMTLLFRILQGDKPVTSGTLAMGGEFNGNGYRLSSPEFRRVVTTDLVRDHGVIPIWAGALFFSAALLFWLPVRLFFPRREILFMETADVVYACSRAEGGRIMHDGIFLEALDFLDAGGKIALTCHGKTC